MTNPNPLARKIKFNQEKVKKNRIRAGEFLERIEKQEFVTDLQLSKYIQNLLIICDEKKEGMLHTELRLYQIRYNIEGWSNKEMLNAFRNLSIPYIPK
ncbi:hypothetical protein HC864_05980 [Candidatus Gracilibacteria bacterium]|nr:hypothetical protein [Candidatus Gracilibacteria bacterium]